MQGASNIKAAKLETRARWVVRAGLGAWQP